MSVSVIARCDNCGGEAEGFSLPMKFGNAEDGVTIEVSVTRNAKGRVEPFSLDYCRRCFTELLVIFATNVKPPGVSIEWKDGRWENIPQRPGVPSP